jgi:hypothetical protein
MQAKASDVNLLFVKDKEQFVLFDRVICDSRV